MVWNRLLMFLLFTLCITGSISYAVVYLLEHAFKVKNPYLILAWQKTVLILYAVPVLFCALFLSKLDYGAAIGIKGPFWTDRSKLVDKICMAAEIIWVCGVLAQALETLRWKRQLDSIWAKNRMVRNRNWNRIFEEYRQRFQLSKVEFYQNNQLRSPVSAWYGRHMIVIPVQEYTDKEICMILAHEMNHIKYKDLFWRRLALVFRWINWYNPLVCLFQKGMIYQQEVMCDLRSGAYSADFTWKEYGYFLVNMTDNEFGCMPLTALCESKNTIMGRLQMMTQAKKFKKPKKLAVVVTCVGLGVTSLIPSGIVSARVIAAEENRIYATEVEHRYVMEDLENSGEVKTGIADGNVTEIDLSKDISERSTVSIDSRIEKITRTLYQYKKMTSGDKVIILTSCENENAVYRIGVKNEDTGELSYVEGKGVSTFTYSVTADGNYSAYVENRSSQVIAVQGSVTYKEMESDKGLTDYVEPVTVRIVQQQEKVQTADAEAEKVSFDFEKTISEIDQEYDSQYGGNLSRVINDHSVRTVEICENDMEVLNQFADLFETGYRTKEMQDLSSIYNLDTQARKENMILVQSWIYQLSVVKTFNSLSCESEVKIKNVENIDDRVREVVFRLEQNLCVDGDERFVGTWMIADIMDGEDGSRIISMVAEDCIYYMMREQVGNVLLKYRNSDVAEIMREEIFNHAN